MRDHVGNRLDLAFEDCGEQKLKNIEKPVRVYSISPGTTLPSRRTSPPIKRRGPQEERPSRLPFLPFNNMSGDPEQEYFSDGITEDIITDLSKISGLFVIARNSSFIYKNKPRTGAACRPVSSVSASFSKAACARRARVSASRGQLVSYADGGHLWADRFDRDLTDIFAIQDEITHAIVEQLKVTAVAPGKKVDRCRPRRTTLRPIPGI